MSDKVLMWEGRPVTELSREELIEALEWCAQQIRYYNSSEFTTAFSLGKIEKIKRGEDWMLKHILICGEAWGAEEAREGRPFVGPSGYLLTECFAARGSVEMIVTSLMYSTSSPNRATTSRTYADLRRRGSQGWMQLRPVNIFEGNTNRNSSVFTVRFERSIQTLSCVWETPPSSPSPAASTPSANTAAPF